MMSILRVISWMLVVMMMVGFPPSFGDFAQDKRECQDKLIGLSSCLAFITGEGDGDPTSSCCLQLSETYNQSRRCLCLLVRDRNEPNLGFKLNATLALSLPYRCHIPANESECIDLLKLDPHSEEARIFQQFTNTTTAAGGADNTSNSHSGTSMLLNKRRFHFLMTGGIWVLLLLLKFLH